jgi:3',5'-nucleoside bisphosphate phosphatase
MSSETSAERAELHTHSTASDGQFVPFELARQVHEAGAQWWALTDHDTCNGVAVAAEEAARLGIHFLSGIEVSAQHGRSVHVLGYGVDTQHAGLLAFMASRLDDRHARMDAMVRKLNSIGAHVTMADVMRYAKKASPARPHLARALIENGYVNTVEEAFARFIGDGKPGYVDSPWPTVAEAIDIIHDAGGVAVLAHPGQYELDDKIGEWVDAGLDGIEVIHPRHDGGARWRYEQAAERYGLLRTGGSDFHGPSVAPDRKLGQAQVPRAWLDALWERAAR